MPYRSTKTFTHAIGLSCAFRQWRAKSHCSNIHGYALEVRVEFEADALDEHGWVVDFGGLKALRARLEDLFDHKLLIAQDDPLLPALMDLDRVLGVADIRVVQAVGCEAFARRIFDEAVAWTVQARQDPRVRVAQVEVREHGGNSAIFISPGGA